MQTLVLFGCCFPLGLIPTMLPARFIKPLKPAFRWLGVLPLIFVGFFFVSFNPLGARLGYAVALFPVLIAFSSLNLAIIGIRLVLGALIAGEPWGGLALVTVLAALPILLVSPFLAYALVNMLIRLSS